MLKEEIAVSELLRLSNVELAGELGLYHTELLEDAAISELVVWLIICLVVVETKVLDSADMAVVMLMLAEEENSVDVRSKLLMVVSGVVEEEISAIGAEMVVCIVAEVVDVISR